MDQSAARIQFRDAAAVIGHPEIARTVHRHAVRVVVLARLEPELHPIRAGVYAIKPGMKPRELLAQFVSGKVLEFSVQFIEGWSFRQLRAELAAAPRLNRRRKSLRPEENRPYPFGFWRLTSPLKFAFSSPNV